MIAIIDYGIGNLGSVKNAFDYLGFPCEITADKDKILKADKVVLPGVGAFSVALNTFRERGFEEVIKEIIKMNKPLLGICLGMQMLFEHSYEYGVSEGLGLLKGDIIRFDNQVGDINFKVPQIGWNSLQVVTDNPLFTSLDKEYVYFVHSFHVANNDEFDNACLTTYAGVTFPSAVVKNNIFATQFHPEKSGEVGLAFLRKFGEL